MSKLEEKDILGRLKVWRSCAKIYLAELWTKKDARVYKRIVELIKIFFAEEISSGPIKEDISRPVLIEWLQGINQAATAVNDHYVMKATTQLIEILQRIGMDKAFIEKKARELMDLFRRGKEEHDELPLHTAKNIVRYMQKPEITKGWLPTAENINALPDPVQDYIADMQTNADPPSMVADNIIMKDTIKTLEKMLEERPTVDEFFEIKVAEYERGLKDAKASELPEITEAWTDAKAKEIKALVKDAQDEDLSDPVTSLHYLGLSLDIVTSIINDLRPKK